MSQSVDKYACIIGEHDALKNWRKFVFKNSKLNFDVCFQNKKKSFKFETSELVTNTAVKKI